MTSYISDILTQKRPLETSFDGNSQKRSHSIGDVDGDNFFGLPHKVKHMFKKHKRITQLYGSTLLSSFFKYVLINSCIIGTYLMYVYVNIYIYI